MGAPGDAIAGWVEGVEALALGDAAGLRVSAAEGCERGWFDAESGRVPGGGDESAVLEREDEGFGNGGVFCGLVGEGDAASGFLPSGVPGLGIFVVPLLLEDRGAVGSELDEEGAVVGGGHASATGVEAFDLVCGVGGYGEEGAEQ